MYLEAVALPPGTRKPCTATTTVHGPPSQEEPQAVSWRFHTITKGIGYTWTSAVRTMKGSVRSDVCSQSLDGNYQPMRTLRHGMRNGRREEKQIRTGVEPLLCALGRGDGSYDSSRLRIDTVPQNTQCGGRKKRKKYAESGERKVSTDSSQPSESLMSRWLDT